MAVVLWNMKETIAIRVITGVPFADTKIGVNMRKLRFYKEADGKWYVDLPEWLGEKDELEMVMGADTMLDLLSHFTDEVTVRFSTEPFENYDYTMVLRVEEYEGATYELTRNGVTFDVWLCHVTKFVFGEFPKTLYIK